MYDELRPYTGFEALLHESNGDVVPRNGGTTVRTIVVIALLILIGSVTCWADDHGNSPLAASPIEADGVLITACIEDAGDMDYFLFHATAGRTYRINTSHPTEEMDSILYLIEPDGQGILAVDDNSGGETNARIVWTCTESGIYFLMVRHAQATMGTGCYGLSASIAQLDDHGNDRFSASPLSSGVTAAGFLEEPGDVHHHSYLWKIFHSSSIPHESHSESHLPDL